METTLIENFWRPIVIVLAVVGLAHVVAAAFAQQPTPTSPDFQSSYEQMLSGKDRTIASYGAQILADQRELAKLAAVEKERDELKAKLAEGTAIRGSTPPEPHK